MTTYREGLLVGASWMLVAVALGLALISFFDWWDREVPAQTPCMEVCR